MRQESLIEIFAIFIFFTSIIFNIYPSPIHGQEEIRIESKKISYDLPYAGMLPDNPLFFIKNVRDKILEFATRDQIKKASLYLLFADKRIRMAIELSEKGKWELATVAVEEAEKYLAKINPLLVDAQKQGMSSGSDFILTLKLSIEKHREVIESLLKNVPQGERVKIEKSLSINQKIAETVSLL
ncbi:MAG TPA: DUF5667 domain-containing protein [Patescibacteria group bacterium]|nr:DUF5667 domain-containing protein [Patescibacteria group bacterium]